MLDTWKAMESLLETGRCKAIGLSDDSLAQLQEIFAAARVKPAVLQVESIRTCRSGKCWIFANAMAS